ncbi:MAG: hypothetical protein AAFX99_22020, partial [Myxococcota bacterium]
SARSSSNLSGLGSRFPAGGASRSSSNRSGLGSRFPGGSARSSSNRSDLGDRFPGGSARSSSNLSGLGSRFPAGGASRSSSNLSGLGSRFPGGSARSSSNRSRPGDLIEGISYNDDPNALPDRGAPPPLVVDQNLSNTPWPHASSPPERFQDGYFNTDAPARESSSLVPPTESDFRSGTFQPDFQSRMSGAIEVPEDVFGGGGAPNASQSGAPLGNNPMAPPGSQLSSPQTNRGAIRQNTGGNDLEHLFNTPGRPPVLDEEEEEDLVTAVAPGAADSPFGSLLQVGTSIDTIAADLPTSRHRPGARPSGDFTPAGVVRTHQPQPLQTDDLNSGPGFVEAIEFWPGVGAAFLVPFKGLSWLGLMAAFLTFSAFFPTALGFLGLAFAVLLMFMYVGLLCVYYGRVAQVGIEGRDDAPELGGVTDAFSEPMKLIIPGLLTFLLTLILFAPAGFLTASAFSTPEAAPQHASRPLLGSDLFFDANGDEIDLDEIDSTIVGYTTGDASSPMLTIDPQAGTVTPVDSVSSPTPEEPDVSMGQWLLILIGLLLPAFYLPMALAVASLTGSLANMFNPFYVMQGIFSGGVAYVFIVVLGIATYIGTLTLSGMLSGSGVIVLQLAGLAMSSLALTYVVGVQGYLVGRLIGSRPEAFDDFFTQ